MMDDALKQFSNAIQSIGWPGTLLALTIFAAWRFARWSEPRFNELFAAHVEFVKTMSVEFPKQTERMDRHSDLLDQTKAVVHQTGEKVSELHSELVERVAARRAAREERETGGAHA